MEMTKQELKKTLNNERGIIREYEITLALGKFQKNGDLSILETIESRKKIREDKRKLHSIPYTELTEVEALRRIVNQNSVAIDVQKTMKGWLMFLGIMYIITIVGFIFINITS